MKYHGLGNAYLINSPKIGSLSVLVGSCQYYRWAILGGGDPRRRIGSVSVKKLFKIITDQ